MGRSGSHGSPHPGVPSNRNRGGPKLGHRDMVPHYIGVGGRRVARRLAPTAVIILAAWAAPGAAAAQVTWHVSRLPTASIGDGTGESQELFRVEDATVAPDGHILVLNGGSYQVRVYSAQGQLLNTIGRRGQGPGEFLVPTELRVTAGGQVLVYDRGGGRLTTFTPDGKLVGTRSIFYAVGAKTSFATGFLGNGFRPFADGSVPLAFVDVSILDAYHRGEGLFKDDVEVDVHDGDRMRRILRRPRGPTYTARAKQRGLPWPVPFEEEVLLAAGPRTVAVGTSHDTVFQRFDRDGKLVGEYTASGSTRPVTARDWDLYKARLHEKLDKPISLPGVGKTPDHNPAVDRFLEKTPRGKHMPLFDKLLLDDQGRLWAREYSLEGDTVTWQAVADGGRTLGRVELPRDWEVFEFGEGYVLVRVRGKLDVEIVRKYGIEP